MMGGSVGGQRGRGGGGFAFREGWGTHPVMASEDDLGAVELVG